ncbi:MAG: flippase [Actinomycetota bacterium]
MKDKLIQIGRDSAWYLSANIVVSLIGFAAFPMLTRLLGPSQYGVFSLINTAIVLGSPIFYVFLTSSTLRFYPVYEKDDRLDVFYSTVFHFLPHFMVLCFCVLLPVASFVLPLGRYRGAITVGVAVFALYTVFNVTQVLLRVRQESLQYSAMAIFTTFARYLVGVALVAWTEAGVAGPFWAWAGGLLIAIPVELVWLKTRKYFRWKLYSKGLFREFFHFGFVLIFVTFSVEIMTAADRYMVQIFKGSYQVGLYSAVYILVMTIENLMATFIMMGTVPVMMRVFEHDGKAAAEVLLGKVTRYLLMMLTPSMVAAWVLREPLIRVVAGARYAPAEPAVLPLVIGVFLSILAWPTLQVFYMEKRTSLTLIPIGTAALSNILINLVLIPRYGFPGAAWATMISYALYLAIAVVLSSRYMRWQFPWGASARIGLASAVMGAGLWGMERAGLSGPAGLLAMIAAGALIYVVVILLVGGISRPERRFAMELVAKIPLVGRAVPARWHLEPKVEELLEIEEKEAEQGGDEGAAE